MVIFNSFLLVYQRVRHILKQLRQQLVVELRPLMRPNASAVWHRIWWVRRSENSAVSFVPVRCMGAESWNWCFVKHG